jgi:hypothetical protein
LTQQAYRQYAKVRQGAAAPDRGEQTRPAEADGSLIFHLDFENGPDASVSNGVGTPTVTGNLTYEKTPQGSRAAVVGKGVSLSYPPEGNVDLQRGKIYMHFKPLWHGVDGKTHEFLRVSASPGLMYLGKAADGRLIMNMIDDQGKQHWARPTTSGSCSSWQVRYGTRRGRDSTCWNWSSPCSYSWEEQAFLSP